MRLRYYRLVKIYGSESNKLQNESCFYFQFVAPPRKKVVKKAVKRKYVSPKLTQSSESKNRKEGDVDAGSNYDSGRRRSRRLQGQVIMSKLAVGLHLYFILLWVSVLYMSV